MAAEQTLVSRAVSLEDNLPTYLAICRAFGRRQQHKEAYDMSVDILRMMGAIPEGNFGMKMTLGKDLMFLKRFFARHLDANILAIPLLEDNRLEPVFELLRVAATHAYYCGAMVSEHVRAMLGCNSKLQLAVYFHEDDLALQGLQGLDLLSADSEAGFHIQSVRLCFSSLAYSTLYRNRHKRSYLNKSKRYLRELKCIYQMKGTVCWHRCMLMEAHLLEAVKKGKQSTSILDGFDRAIEAASSKGWDHDAALGSQLAAEYCVNVMQGIPNKDSIEFTTMATLFRRYLQQANNLYKSWGAMALISHLENRYHSLLVDVSVHDS